MDPDAGRSENRLGSDYPQQFSQRKMETLLAAAGTLPPQKIADNPECLWLD